MYEKLSNGTSLSSSLRVALTISKAVTSCGITLREMNEGRLLPCEVEKTQMKPLSSREITGLSCASTVSLSRMRVGRETRPVAWS